MLETITMLRQKKNSIVLQPSTIRHSTIRQLYLNKSGKTQHGKMFRIKF